MLHCIQDIDDIGLDQRHKGLGCRIIEANVVIDKNRTSLGDDDADRQDSLVGHALGLQAKQGGLYDGIDQGLADFFLKWNRADGTHTTGRKAAFFRFHVVAAGRQGKVPFVVQEEGDGDGKPVEVFLQNNRAGGHDAFRELHQGVVIGGVDHYPAGGDGIALHDKTFAFVTLEVFGKLMLVVEQDVGWGGDVMPVGEHAAEIPIPFKFKCPAW